MKNFTIASCRRSEAKWLGLLQLGVALFLLFATSASAQYQYYITFRGTNYEADASGKIAATPMTERSMLQELGAAVGMTDVSGWALVYHIVGDMGFKGDTIEVVNISTGQTLDRVFGLFYGDEQLRPDLNRVALTNAPGTEALRIDYVYTYPKQNQNTHSMGAAFVTKRFLSDANNSVRPTIEGTIHWVVAPLGASGTKIRIGTFTTTKLFVPKP